MEGVDSSRSALEGVHQNEQCSFEAHEKRSMHEYDANKPSGGEDSDRPAKCGASDSLNGLPSAGGRPRISTTPGDFGRHPECAADNSYGEPPGTSRWPSHAPPTSGKRATIFDGPSPDSSTHRARVSEPPDNRRASKAVVLLKFAGFYDGDLSYTEVAGTVELNDYARQGFGNRHVDSALFSLPIIPVENINLVLDILETAGHNVIRYSEYPITPPVVWRSDRIDHVAKVDFHDVASEGHSYSLLERMINAMHETVSRRTVPNYGFDHLRGTVPAYDLMRTTYQASVSSQDVHRAIASALMSALNAFPFMPAPYAAPSDRSGRFRSSPHCSSAYHTADDYSRSIKRSKWSDNPAQEIAKELHVQWEDGTSIQRFHYELMGAIHSDLSTRIPELLAEKQPIKYIMDAFLIKHKTPSGAPLSSDASTARALSGMLAQTQKDFATEVAMAAEDPNHVPNQKAVVHCIAQGLADIRTVYCRTSRPGTLHSEALRLITSLRTIDTSQGDVLFSATPTLSGRTTARCGVTLSPIIFSPLAL